MKLTGRPDVKSISTGSGWLCLLGLLLWASVIVQAHATSPPSVAFYYGQQPPVDLLGQFDWVVVEADHLSPTQLSSLKAKSQQVFAYISLGEIEHWRDGRAICTPRCPGFGPREGWDSEVADLTQKRWQAHILKRVKALHEKGYSGLFLDTLDSYYQYLKDDEKIARQQQALIKIIRRIHQKYPDTKLFFNRGFEVLPEVHELAAGVAAESLFRQWDANTKQYRPVAKKDRRWLKNKLDAIHNKWHLPIVVLDYVPAHDRKTARQTAKKIANFGFSPWVSNYQLNQMGVGLLELRPRKVLMLYQKAANDDIASEPVLDYAAMPLEYLGYMPKYQNIDKGLPSDELRGRVAGIVAWFNGPLDGPSTAYKNWLEKQLKSGVPIAMLGSPGINLNALLPLLGLKETTASTQKLSVQSHTKMLGFETLPENVPPGTTGYVPTRKNSQHVKSELLIKDIEGLTMAPVLTADWGGLALDPWIVKTEPLIDSQSANHLQARWIINPFKFFKKALHLSDQPAPDPTTENGRRIFTSHIDGDGFANRARMPGEPFAGQVILDQILKHYDLPITVSVIEGEVGPNGLNPKDSPQLEAIARESFALPNVEIATHTFSHPFDWHAMYEGRPAGVVNLPIKGYRYSTKREIQGSVDYINSRLAPKDKKTKVVLWSGDALPPERAIAWADRLGLANVNGGNTRITKSFNSLTDVSPMTRPAGKRLQVFAPIINDNVYTHEFSRPKWGFRHVIQTFELTDKPRRLKPISVYYHYFSGALISATNAIKAAYDAALEQPIMPMFTSAYYQLVKNYTHITLAQDLSGTWIIRGAHDNRTIRIPKTWWPDLAASKGVVGVKDLEQGRYVALSGADNVRLVVSGQRPTQPYLESANGRVKKFQKTDTGFQLSLQAQVPLRLTLTNIKGCEITAPKAHQDAITSNKMAINYGSAKAGHVAVRCP